MPRLSKMHENNLVRAAFSGWFSGPVHPQMPPIKAALAGMSDEEWPRYNRPIMTTQQVRESVRYHLNRLEHLEAELADLHAVAADAQSERNALKKRIESYASGFTIETIDHDLRELTR